MKFDTVRDAVGGVPYISQQNARLLYDRIVEGRLASCLELGFAHGAASCYIAAALDELGEGHLTSVDLVEAKQWQNPSIEELLAKCGLEAYVTVAREQTGYNWFLHDEIARRSASGQCEPVYDFCIIDGPKNWTIDGMAFFLADKLIKPGGWIVFDDYDWTYEAGDREATDGITHRAMSDAERTTPQIREVFHLLVMQHPDYGEFRVHDQGDWAWARKSVDANVKRFVLERRESSSDLLAALARRLQRVLRGGAH